MGSSWEIFLNDRRQFPRGRGGSWTPGDRMVGLPYIHLRLPIEIESRGGDFNKRPAIDLKERERERSPKGDDRYDHEKPCLYKKVTNGADHGCPADIHELPERKRSDDLILGVDELWNLVLHAPSV